MNTAPFLRIDDEPQGGVPDDPHLCRLGKVAWDANGWFWRLVLRDGNTGWEVVSSFGRLNAEPVDAAALRSQDAPRRPSP